MKPKLVQDTANCETWRVMEFHFQADENDVIVTKNVKNGMFVSVASYQYKNHNTACEAAWKMALKQSKT